MKKPAFGKISGWAALAAAMALGGCAEIHTTIPVLDVKNGDALPRQWERYGAYYIADDLIVSTNATAGSESAVTEFTVFKKIKILNTQGAVFGTIPIRHYSDDLALFECSAADASGKRVPLSTVNLRAEYEESGTVVVPSPQVLPGTTISLRMVFAQRHAPPMFEHWFTESIPVQAGRLVVHADVDMRFSYNRAVYGGRAVPQESSPGHYGGKTMCWTIANLEPRDSLAFRPPVSESEPRVGLRINPLYGTHGEIIGAWTDMGRVMDQLVVDQALDNSEEEIAAKADEVTRGKKDDKTRAVAIVEWVQQNIVCQSEPVKSKVVDLLHGGRSDMLLSTLLCKEMLKASGVRADVILTRAHSRGGFDSTFMSNAECREGLLVANFDGSEFVICPTFCGYPIGAYPPDYFDLSGLNMNSYKIVKLPPSRWKRHDQRSRVLLSLSSDTVQQTIFESFRELSAQPLRGKLARQSENQQRQVVEQLLRRHGNRNSLESFSIQGLGDYDPAVMVTMRFRADNPPQEIAGSLRYDLSQLLKSPYADIDSTRRCDIVMSAAMVHIDTIEVRKESGMQISLDATPWHCSDSLLEARVGIEQTPSSVLFIRDVQMRKGRVAGSDIGALVNDLRQLDRASKATAVVRPLAAHRR